MFPAKPTVGLLLLVWFVHLPSALHAGATGEESLGSEERPVIWSFVDPDASEQELAEIESFLVPIELETGYLMDARAASSYSKLFSLLEAGEVHVVVLPALTHLIAADRGLVVDGIVDSIDQGMDPGSLVLAPRGSTLTSIVGNEPIRIARFDPPSQRDWLLARIAISASGLTSVETVDFEDRDGVIEAVENGAADLGVIGYLAEAPVPENLEIIVEIEDVPGSRLCFLSSLPDDIRKAVESSLLNRSTQGQSLGFLAYQFGWSEVTRPSPVLIDRYRSLLRSAGIDIASLP